MRPAISFDKVLVTDGMAWTLFGLAQKEGLLYTAQGEGFSGRSPRRRERQAALSLILLFDKLIVHDLSPGTGSYRLPDLERDGVLESRSHRNFQQSSTAEVFVEAKQK